MSQSQQQEFAYPGIDAESHSSGWRRDLKEAIDAALADAEENVPYEARIFVRKRRDNPVHDYKVELGGTP